MRKLYNEFFFIPKHGKIREKVMLTHVALTIAIMIACLAAMSITAYAYFSYNVTSGSNIIKAANFEANVLIMITDPNNAEIPVKKEGDIFTANLASGTYTIELTKGESTADTGFCIITIGETEYHTQQIGIDGETVTPSVSFKLKIAADTKVAFLSHWGTSSYYGYTEPGNHSLYIGNGEIIDLTPASAGAGDVSVQEEQSTTGETTATEDINGSKAADTIPPASTTPTEIAPDQTTEVADPSAAGGEPSAESEGALEETAPTQLTESTDTESGSVDSVEQTRPAAENTENSGEPTTEASE